MANIGNEFGFSSTSRLASHPRLRGDLREGVQAVQVLKETGEATLAHDEALIVDARSGVSPAQMVENKLSKMLKDTSMPVSHLQTRGLLRAR